MKQTASYFFLFCTSMALLICDESTSSNNGAYIQLSSAQTQIPDLRTGSLITSEPEAAPVLGKIVSNFEIKNKDLIICKIPGIYLVCTGLQVSVLAPEVSGYLDCWYELNNKPIPVSNSREYVNQDSKTTLLVNSFLISLKKDDELGIKFIASSPDIGIICIKNLANNEPDILSFGASVIKID